MSGTGHAGGSRDSLSTKEVRFVRELQVNKWDRMVKKLENVADEVFTEVMQQEMQLARIENENFSDIVIPDDIKME